MSRPQSGPPLIMPGLAFLGLAVAGIAIGAGGPRPSDAAPSVLAYVQNHATAMRWGAFLAFAAAIPLAIWTAAVYRRLRALGVTAPGSAIALAGGLLAASMTAVSGLFSWVESRANTDASLAAALRDVTFVTGGPGFVAFLGILLAGVSVPMLLLGINRPVAIFGLAIALFAEISTVVLLTMSVTFTLPIGRFGGIIWLIAVSLVLPASRHRQTPPAVTDGQAPDEGSRIAASSPASA